MEAFDEIIVHMSSKLDKIDIIVERLPYIQERLDMCLMFLNKYKMYGRK